MTAFCSRTAIATVLLLSAVPAVAQAGDVSCGPQQAGQAQSVETLRYTHSQGLRIIARSWLQSIKPPAERGFDAAGLGRFGFAPMEVASADQPAAFQAKDPAAQPMASAACPTCQPQQLASQNAGPQKAVTSKSLDFESLVAEMKNRKLAIASAAF